MKTPSKRPRRHLASSTQAPAIEEQEQDRLSSLNDHILHHILSFLPTNQVIRTSVLSPRWKLLWSTAPHLHFEDAHFSHPVTFMNFVDRALLLLSPPSNLLSFRLSLISSRIVPYRAESWLRSALVRSAQQLHLHIVHPKNFQLPSSLFHSSSLRVLKLSESLCDPLHWPSQSQLPSLETLDLCGVHFGTGTPNNMISSCHSCLKNLSLKKCNGLDSLTIDECCQLEDLSIKSCTGLQQLSVSARRLRNFRIAKSFDTSAGINTAFAICAPSLESFVWSDLPPYQFSSKSSMAVIGYSYIRYTTTAPLTDVTAVSALKLLVKLADSRKLTMNCVGIHLLSAGARNCIARGKEIYRFKNIEELRAVIGFGALEVVELVNLLKSCPNLMNLVISNTKRIRRSSSLHEQYVCDLNRGGYWESQDICLKHLLEAKFVEFEGTAYEIDFIKFLVQHVSTLQRLTIMTSVSAPPCKRREVAQTLATLPSASPNLRLLFLSP